MKRILAFVLVLALALPVLAQSVDEYKFSLVPRRPTTLPANSAGYLLNDGSGGLSWGALDLSPYVKKDGSTELTADWNVGAFDVTANNLTASPTLGATLLTNGDFATNPTGTNTPWMEGTSTNIGTAWVYSSGKLRHATASTTTLRQVITCDSGDLLKVVFTIAQDGATPIAGTIKVTVGGTGTLGISDTITVAAGTYTRYLYATSTSTYYVTFTPSTTLTATIDDISAQVVTGGEINAIDIIPHGQIKLQSGNKFKPGLTFDENPVAGMSYSGTNTAIQFSMGSGTSGDVFTIRTSSVALLNDAYYYGWRSGTTRLYSDADYQLDLRSTTNPQIFNVYNTYTSATSYERGFLRTTATAVEVGSEKGSAGGTARPVGIFTDGVERVTVDTSGNIAHVGLNAQKTNIQQATVVVTTTAAATATATNLIPAGSMVVGVTCRNTTAVTGDAGFTGYSIGDGVDDDRWGANVSPSLNETTDLTDAVVLTPAIFTAATSVVLTQVGGSVFVADATIRVTVHYISLTAPST